MSSLRAPSGRVPLPSLTTSGAYHKGELRRYLVAMEARGATIGEMARDLRVDRHRIVFALTLGRERILGKGAA